MQIGRRVRVRAGSGVPLSDPNYALNSTAWTVSLAQNTGANARIALPEGLAAGRNAMAIIRGIQVTSFDACLWEFWFWSTSTFGSGDSREAFRGLYAFPAVGLQIAANGLYHASAASLDLFYEDDDAMTAQGASGQAATNSQTGAFLNVTLLNRSAGGKTAAAWFDVTFVLEACLGW